jgi:hypothetical protein
MIGERCSPTPSGFFASVPELVPLCFSVAVAEDKALLGSNLSAVDGLGLVRGVETCPTTFPTRPRAIARRARCA